MFNMRLTGFTSKKWMIAHWTFFSTLVCFVIVSALLVVFQCKPPRAGFNSIAAGHLDVAPVCWSELKLNTGLSVWHVLSDFCLLAVPVIVLWKTQMKWNTKARLYIVGILGLTSCISSVIRLVYQHRIGIDPLCMFSSNSPADKSLLTSY